MNCCHKHKMRAFVRNLKSNLRRNTFKNFYCLDNVEQFTVVFIDWGSKKNPTEQRKL